LSFGDWGGEGPEPDSCDLEEPKLEEEGEEEGKKEDDEEGEVETEVGGRSGEEDRPGEYEGSSSNDNPQLRELFHDQGTGAAVGTLHDGVGEGALRYLDQY
jgi:hypothetical protein